MLNYNAPMDGQKSSIDGNNSDQVNKFFFLRKAMVEARKEQYFMPLASTINMPKHMGKHIKVYEYIPLLDDRNVNSQGIDAAGVVIANGNLYGSSRDVGTIVGRLPLLTENGGRVNRVGFTRLSREGTLHKFGFFFEFTQESLNFDSDSDLMTHLARELMNGAVQLSEAVLQKDLLAAAQTVLFAGAATADDEITGEEVDAGGGVKIPPSIVDYEDLVRLDQILNDNRTPKQTKVITGSRNTDTKTLPSGRVMFMGSEMVPVMRRMRDSFNNAAFIAVQHYGDAGTVLNGEIGTVDSFRLIVVPEMLHWDAAGAEVVKNPGYRTSTKAGKQHYNIYPLLVVGDDSFATIGFQTDGKSGKFDVLTKMPGRETADRNDPFGESGFSSIKWYYGFMAKRPERIALIKTVAPV